VHGQKVVMAGEESAGEHRFAGDGHTEHPFRTCTRFGRCHTGSLPYWT
jgi:hypothetical protein